jgi:hypothetical protein
MTLRFDNRGSWRLWDSDGLQWTMGAPMLGQELACYHLALNHVECLCRYHQLELLSWVNYPVNITPLVPFGPYSAFPYSGGIITTGLCAKHPRVIIYRSYVRIPPTLRHIPIELDCTHLAKVNPASTCLLWRRVTVGKIHNIISSTNCLVKEGCLCVVDNRPAFFFFFEIVFIPVVS